MPESWYSFRGNSTEEDDTEEIKEQKRINRLIAAEKKPYFMIYVYPTLKKEYTSYMNSCNRAAIRRFGHLGVESVKDLLSIKEPTSDVTEFLDYYYRLMPVGLKKCTVNKICWKIEDELGDKEIRQSKGKRFDYTILKSAADYKQSVKVGVSQVIKDYEGFRAEFAIRSKHERIDKYDNWIDPNSKKQYYQDTLSSVCSNDDELCNALIDVCYKNDSTKGLVWELYGEMIVQRLLDRAGGTVQYPVEVEAQVDFEFRGKFYRMERRVVNQE